MRRRLAIVVAILAVSALAGYAIGDRPDGGIIDTFFGAPRKARTQMTPEQIAIQQQQEEYRARTLQRVSKFIQDGIIQRIDEGKRALYVNDGVWKAAGRDRQEHIARVVAEYLDAVKKQDLGIVEVLSFRSGRRLAWINDEGAFTIFY